MFFLGSVKPPPGTVFLSDNLYIDQAEISNFEWIEYLIWLKQEFGENSNDFKNSIPDNEIWKNLYKTDFSFSLVNNNYLNYPVVGVSYDQANNYCTWRSKLVNEKFKNDKKVNYRLPTKNEFEKAIKLEQLNISKYYNENLNLFKSPEKTKGNFLLFLSNNVSEMTIVKGEAFGGNFNDKSNSLKFYKSPEKWLGFRCIAEIE